MKEKEVKKIYKKISSKKQKAFEIRLPEEAITITTKKIKKNKKAKNYC